MTDRKQVICRTELYKLYKRKDTWLFLTVILVPILYAVGIAGGSEIVSYSGNGNITAVNFMSAMFQIAQSMFIFNIILVAVTSRTLGTEIEDKSLRIYLNKVGDRKKIYIEKVKALIIYVGVISLLLIAVGLFCYYFILNGRTPIVNGALYDKRILIELIQIITICLFWIVTIFITMILSIKYRLVVCLGIYMIGYIGMNLLSYTKLFKYISPLYYINNFATMEKVVWNQLLIGMIYFFLIAFITTYYGIMMFKSKDI